MSKPRDMKEVSPEKRKKTRNGTGHVRLRSDGRWEGQYYFEGERKSCYGKTEEDCRGRLNVILGKIYLSTYIDGSQMPLYAYLHKWHMDYIKVRPSTHSNYDTYIERHIYNSRLGSIPLKKLCLDDFVSFFRMKEVSGRLDNKPGGLAPKTLRNIRNMMSEALEFAINNLRWLSRSPMAGLRTPKVTLPKIQVYTERHQERIELAALQHENKNALLVLIDLYTGLRIGELCALAWQDFNSSKEYFDISSILERLSKKWVKDRPEYRQIPIVGAKPNASTALYLGPPKTDSGKRRIHMSDQAVAAFYDIEMQQRTQGLYKPDGFVFLQANGNPYEPRTYHDLYEDVLRLANVDYQKFHTIRHTFATRAFELDFDIPTLAEILGHAQKSTTENMYGHSLDDSKKRNMAKFNRRLDRAM